jgi:MGT family glycosyltransferase
MKNIHIAFINIPIASNVNPTLPLVEVLARRGYRVTYAVANPFISRVESSGAEVAEYKFDALTAKNTDQTSYCRLAIKTLAATRALYERSIPDLVVYDYVALAGRIIAQQANAPAVRLSVDPAFTQAYLHEQISAPQLREGVLAASERANAFLTEHGVTSGHFLFHREKLNVFHYPREFEPSNEAIDESCIYAGRCPGEQDGFGQWSKPRNADDTATILVAPSRSYMRGREYFAMCVAAFSGMPWRVILSIGDDADLSELLPLPPNFEIVQKVSHTKILPYADVVLGMGGFITSSEAAYHGVPLVMTSCGEMEVEWACENLARIGIGIHLRGGSTNAAALRESVLKVLESSDGATIRNKMMKLQLSVRRGPGAEEVANRIEEILIHEGRARRPLLR